MITTHANCAAFPSGQQSIYDAETGLTKREYFAAMAMQGIATDASVQFEMAAKIAVEYADALIAALNKEPQS
jgi:hypothetical protein